jgi:hypothetical protein
MYKIFRSSDQDQPPSTSISIWLNKKNLPPLGLQVLLFNSERIKAGHGCTRELPGSVPTSISNFKCHTRIRAGFSHQVTRIRKSKTRGFLSSCWSKLNSIANTNTSNKREGETSSSKATAPRVRHRFFCLHVFVLPLYGHVWIYLASDHLGASKIVFAISPLVNGMGNLWVKLTLPVPVPVKTHTHGAYPHHGYRLFRGSDIPYPGYTRTRTRHGYPRVYYYQEVYIIYI